LEKKVKGIEGHTYVLYPPALPPSIGGGEGYRWNLEVLMNEICNYLVESREQLAYYPFNENYM
jgi:hypothetical protein